MLLCNGLGAKDAGAHLNAVEIHLKDALLGPDEFDEKGVVRLQSLTQPRAGAKGKDILCRLLRNRTGAAVALPLLALLKRLLNLVKVKTVVLVKKLVLRRNNSCLQVWRNAFHRYPLVRQLRDATFVNFRQAVANHKGRDGHGYVAVKNDSTDAPHKEGDDQNA